MARDTLYAIGEALIDMIPLRERLRLCRCARLCAPHGAVRLCPSRIFLHGTCIFCQMPLFDEMIAKIL